MADRYNSMTEDGPPTKPGLYIVIYTHGKNKLPHYGLSIWRIGPTVNKWTQILLLQAPPFGETDTITHYCPCPLKEDVPIAWTGERG